MSKSSDRLAEGDGLFGKRDYAAATEVYLDAVALAEADGDHEALVEALCQSARGYLIRDLKDEGRPHLERATAEATPDEPSGWSRYLGVRGRFEWKDDDLVKASGTFAEMYDYCVEHELHSRAVDAAHMVGLTGTLDQQIEWAEKGIAAAEAGDMDGWLGPLWNNLGNTHQDREEMEKAVAAFLKARDYHWKVGSEHAKLVADWAVGMAYRRAGDAQKATLWTRPVLPWAERRYAGDPSPDRAEWVGWACREMAELAAADGRTEEALTFFTRAREMLEIAKMPEWDAPGWQKLVLDRIADLSD